jgi:hypothetical protein
MTRDFNAQPVLARLKDFQVRTVEFAFRRLFLDEDAVRRFLVADEVGLGKTMVARGVIAKAVEHLQEQRTRIDIIYICSNADIAAQNVARLNVTGKNAFVKATRLTLLPLEVKCLREQSINFISFTPGTTFDHGNRGGQKLERKLIFQMLRDQLNISAKGLVQVLQGTAGDGWFDEVNDPLDYDEPIAKVFRAAVKDSALLVRLRELSKYTSDYRRTLTPQHREEARELTSELRRMLAHCCLRALEPDLVILDEFQRFRDLLAAPDSSPAAELAHQLFNYSDDLRVLLLSATPYKMYAAHHEEENHYRDFLQTARFLFGDDPEVDALQDDLRDFREVLMTLDAQSLATQMPARIKAKIEQRLRRVMCRTERVGATAGLDAMVRERSLPVQLASEDLLEFRSIDRLSSAVGSGDPIEYWRSSPYLLNFMKEYELKRQLTDKKNEIVFVEALEGHPAYRTLHKRSLARYESIDPANGRLRALAADIERNQSWRLLWVPPSMPYWRGEGPFELADGFTKTLVFSSWNVVPDAIAGLLSYLIESKSVTGLGRRPRYDQLTRQVRARLRFPVKEDGTFAGMNALALMFPSRVLADLIDPLQAFVEARGKASLSEVRESVRERIERLLSPLLITSPDEFSPPDPRWYWIAIVLLERTVNPEMRHWCDVHWPRARIRAVVDEDGDAHDAEGGFGRHVQNWINVWDGEVPALRRVPKDLIDVLADIALAGPAVCALRALRRVVPETKANADVLSSAAVQIADGLRHQFNAPEAIAMLQQDEEEAAYWKRVLNYCAQGNLQALLDEYVHLLHEAESGGSEGTEEGIFAVAEKVFEAATIRTSQLRPDYPVVQEGRLAMDPDPLSLRCRYAVRYGDAKEEDGAISRKETIRAAFNSPFRPFVLASTSVGQEGLDFHSWCHSIVHWNLPNNPVDLEQREGRVHRYKGHAVRKNVARAGCQGIGIASADPWKEMFELVREGRPHGASDLLPFWIFELPDGATVERVVFRLPWSKDDQRLRRLKASLAIYRMVFGQPRQDDLMEYLLANFDEPHAAEVVKNWRIDLAPNGHLAAPDDPQ